MKKLTVIKSFLELLDLFFIEGIMDFGFNLLTKFRIYQLCELCKWSGGAEYWNWDFSSEVLRN